MTLSTELRPRPPFRLDLTVWALRRRQQNAIDTWDGGTYRRSLRVGGASLELAVTQTGPIDRPRLTVVVAGRLASSREALARATLTRLLGLDADLSQFYARAALDPLLDDLATRYRGLKPPRFPSLLECLLNAVACQQLSLAACLTLVTRLAARTSPATGAAHPAFPPPADILQLTSVELRALGFSERKAHTILALAHAAEGGELEPDRFESLDDAAVREKLMSYPGVGPWSADYVLLRGLGRLHVFPRFDVGALGGLRRFLAAAGSGEDPERALARWHPDGGLIYFHLLLRGLDERGVLEHA